MIDDTRARRFVVHICVEGCPTITVSSPKHYNELFHPLCYVTCFNSSACATLPVSIYRHFFYFTCLFLVAFDGLPVSVSQHLLLDPLLFLSKNIFLHADVSMFSAWDGEPSQTCFPSKRARYASRVRVCPVSVSHALCFEHFFGRRWMPTLFGNQLVFGTLVVSQSKKHQVFFAKEYAADRHLHLVCSGCFH